MTEVSAEIDRLVLYGLRTGLVQPEDGVYTRNRLLAFLGAEWTPVSRVATDDPEGTVLELNEILERLWERARPRAGLNEEYEREVFEAEAINCIAPRPSEVSRMFRAQYDRSPEEATDYFYCLSTALRNVRLDRLSRNMAWQVPSAYGTIDVTINRVKPEKDPADIARGAGPPARGYPACVLCPENQGYRGGGPQPARANHRTVPIQLEGETWHLQYSPYGYFNEHCIVIHEEHVPMQVTAATFERLVAFVERFPHYFLGSNADLPRVGGSILAHDHFQGGKAAMPIERARVVASYLVGGGEARVELLHWPVSVMRVRGERTAACKIATSIWQCWRDYELPRAGIYARTGDERHNTVTPVARRRVGGSYEVDVVLRNNRCTPGRPCGLFHPPEELHHIKKENIGIIEVMGLAILPPRLADELGDLVDLLARSAPVTSLGPHLHKHRAWYQELLTECASSPGVEPGRLLREQAGGKFVEVLEHTGVFKNTPDGRRQFREFAEGVLTGLHG